jgi:periplasmic divalent cation tolerance protein
MTGQIVIVSTCGSEEEAAALAHLLVERRLAACVNVVPRIRSVYRWKGKVESADEWLLLIKSSRELFDSVSQALQAAHSYELPEVIAIPIEAGSPAYLDWLRANTLPEAASPS